MTRVANFPLHTGGSSVTLVVLLMYGVIILISVSLYGFDIEIFVCVVAITAEGSVAEEAL